MTRLVTGGAGYIGADVLAALRQAGNEVVVLDHLSTGDAARVAEVRLVRGSVLDGELLTRVVRNHHITGVVHLAANKQVAESVRRPLFYYRQNVEGLRVLLEAATSDGVTSFVFSSSAAVSGAPNVPVVEEDLECRPVNRYGRTKLVGEQMIEDIAGATEFRYVNLSYADVAGAAEPAPAGRGATNLVPMVFEDLSHRRTPRFFGDDHDPADGPCAGLHPRRGCRLRPRSRCAGRPRGADHRPDRHHRRHGHLGGRLVCPGHRAPSSGRTPRVVASSRRLRAALEWEARYGAEAMVASVWAGRGR
jgi:UDP-glucose 4-epimerase